jgi:hypothetical protein
MELILVMAIPILPLLLQDPLALNNLGVYRFIDYFGSS